MTLSDRQRLWAKTNGNNNNCCNNNETNGDKDAKCADKKQHVKYKGQSSKFHKKSYGKLRRKHTHFCMRNKKRCERKIKKNTQKNMKKRESWKEMALSGCKAKNERNQQISRTLNARKKSKTTNRINQA